MCNNKNDKNYTNKYNIIKINISLKDVRYIMKVSFALSLPVASLVFVCHCIGPGVKLFVKP